MGFSSDIVFKIDNTLKNRSASKANFKILGPEILCKTLSRPGRGMLEYNIRHDIGQDYASFNRSDGGTEICLNIYM